MTELAGNYWQRRATRRRVLGATLGGSILAAGLVSCSSDDSNDKPAGTGASRVSPVEDTTSKAKRGGTYSGLAWTDQPSLDPLTTLRANSPALVAYQHLIAEKVSVGLPKEQTFTGDLAEKWEQTDGGLSLTFRIRADAGLDPRPPTSSRAITADDVVWSWNRYSTTSPLAAQLANKVNPSAPIEAIEKIDNRTVKFKLAFPWAPSLSVFANGQFVTMPQEAEEKFDPKKETRGSGQWMIDEWRPSDRFTWKRNPNYFDKSFPLLDGFSEPIILDYPQRIAQFRAKAIWDLSFLGYQATPGDVISIARDLPQVKLSLAPAKSSVIKSWGFGQRPGSVWKDQRLRQAFSAALDRDALAIVMSGADIYEKAGIPLPLSQGSSMITDFWGDYYLDPRGKEIGEGSAYFNHNVAEAKKLMSAAGYGEGLQQTLHTFNLPEWVKDAEIISQNLADIGLKAAINVHEFNPDYLPNFFRPGPDKLGNYDGFAVFHTATPLGDVFTHMQDIWHSKGQTSAARRWDSGQEKTDAMIEAGLKEFDVTKRKQLAWDLQRQEASYLSGVQFYYAAQPIQVSWPWVKNFLTHMTTAGVNINNRYDRVWIDESLKA